MIAEAIRSIRGQLPAGVRLLAVSKYNPPEAIRQAYDAGQRLFGESQAQELRAKHDLLPPDIEWHFIGHLQTNKIKYIAPYVALIHSVDSPRLLAEISRHGERCGRRIPCLLQLHVAQEETKYGFSFAELDEYLAGGEWKNLPGIELRGLMCMASNVDNEAQIAAEFQSAANFFRHCRETYFPGDPAFSECSWGMSGDWPAAVAHGSTIVRVGSAIFGERNYSK